MNAHVDLAMTWVPGFLLTHHEYRVVQEPGLEKCEPSNSPKSHLVQTAQTAKAAQDMGTSPKRTQGNYKQLSSSKSGHARNLKISRPSEPLLLLHRALVALKIQCSAASGKCGSGEP